MVVQYLFLFILCLSPASGQNLSLLTPNFLASPNAINEWTAMGYSYASGIGAGDKPESDPNLCFRCSNAYPEIMQRGPGPIHPNPERFSFVACSGATCPEIIAFQLSQQDSPGRPAWGAAPEFVTITMGDSDIGILPLILTCIYSIRVPDGRSCDDVIQNGFDVLESEEFKDGLAGVIRAVRNLGRRQYGSGFHIFVTGYARFFNSETTQCNGVIFGLDFALLPAEYLTQDRRRRMNRLAIALNQMIKTAVDVFGNDATYVDYDALFEGHRFCDRFEPNPNDDDTWFFALGTTPDPINQATSLGASSGMNETATKHSRYSLNRTLPDGARLVTDRKISTPRLVSVNGSGANTIPTLGSAAESVAGGENARMSNYWRVFHPKSRGHVAIRSAILQAMQNVHQSRVVPATSATHVTS